MECKCLKCGYKWLARVKAPKQCPWCKSMKWNKHKEVQK